MPKKGRDKRKVEELPGAVEGAGEVEEEQKNSGAQQFPITVLPGDNVTAAVLQDSLSISIGKTCGMAPAAAVSPRCVMSGQARD